VAAALTDVGFERVRIRKAVSALERAGITPGAIAQSASRLARARAALEEQVKNLHGAAVSADEDGKLLVDLQSFSASPREARIRLMQRLVLELGGQVFSKLSALERLDDWIMSGEGRARTLGNCRISRRKRVLVVVREPARSRGLGRAK
jgi:tRNA(Ile)-lysidine synthase